MNRVRVLENAGFLGFLGISRQKNYTNKIKKGLKIVFLQLLQFRRFDSKSIFFVCKITLIEHCGELKAYKILETLKRRDKAHVLANFISETED